MGLYVITKLQIYTVVANSRDEALEKTFMSDDHETELQDILRYESLDELNDPSSEPVDVTDDEEDK